MNWLRALSGIVESTSRWCARDGVADASATYPHLRIAMSTKDRAAGRVPDGYAQASTIPMIARSAGRGDYTGDARRRYGESRSEQARTEYLRALREFAHAVLGKKPPKG